MDRREFLRTSGLVAGGVLLAKEVSAQGHEAKPAAATPSAATHAAQPVVAPGGQRAVVTPNGVSLAWRKQGQIKIGHMIAQPIDHEFTPGLRADCWGYNGRTPGPTLEVTEGDHVRMYVTNRLPEATSMHWHGVLVPNGMDGVVGLTQPPIEPGQTFKYEF
ncbi:MAG: hypothetical protein RL701_3676, partial [Pseudomonadota bacterium]